MVASSSTANQAAENEKRKKQTMEKVKVNHLSRQLQMRLQYARLKVEHGWQKQNLNEVENLYFHNSHLRGPKTYPVPTIVTAQSQPSLFPAPQMSFAQSRLSFRFGSTPIRHSNTTGSLLSSDSNGHNGSQGESNFNHAAQQETIAAQPNSTIITDPSAELNASDDSPASIPTESMHTTPTLSITSPLLFALGSNENASNSPDDHMASAPESTASPQDGQFPTDIPQNAANYYPSVKHVRPRPNKVLPGPRSQISLTAKDMYNFGSSSTLTYDSFWSTHSGSNTPRSRGSIGTTPAEYPPTFQVPGDFTSGVQENGRSMSTSIFSSSSSFGSVPFHLEQARNTTGPT